MEVYSPWMFKYIVAARDWPHIRLRGISAHKLYTKYTTDLFVIPLFGF